MLFERLLLTCAHYITSPLFFESFLGESAANIKVSFDKMTASVLY